MMILSSSSAVPSRRAWSLRTKPAPGMMEAAHSVVLGDRTFEDGSISWPKLSKA